MAPDVEPTHEQSDAFATFEAELSAKLDEIRQAAADIYSGALNAWHGANKITKLCNEVHAPLPKETHDEQHPIA